MINEIKNNPKRLFTFSYVFVVIAIILIIMFFVRDGITYFSTKTVKPLKKPPVNTNLPIQNDLMAYNIVVKNNIFGIKSEELRPLKSDDSNRHTDIDYKLIGTIAGADKYSFAIFLSRDNSQEIFKVGSSIGSLGRLSKVYPAKVIISSNGQSKEIPLAEIVKIEEVKQPPPIPHSMKGSDFARQTGDRSFVVDQKKIQQAIDNPNQIMTDARLLPNFVDGVHKGFVIREIKQGGIYHSLGLRDGDVLLKINDYNINSPESGLQAFTALRGFERVNLDIIRGNTNLTLNYLIR